MNKYEQLIEYIINEDEDKAKALFHDIVVEKSRDIYESLMDEETVDETIGGNEVEDLVDEIQADETDGIPEGEEEEMDAEEEMMGGSDEEDHHADVGGDEALEDKVMDLEKELDELKAEFDALMSDEMETPGMDADMEADADEMKTDAEELEMYEGDKKEEEAVEEEKEEEVSEDAEEVAEDEEVVEDAEEVAESTKPKAKYTKSATDLMREYVEKVAMPAGEDNKAVSPVASKNDMGGKAVDPTGGDSNPDGTSAPKEGKVDSMPHAGNYQNVPGAKADLSKATGAKTAEEGGVNKDSVEKGGN